MTVQMTERRCKSGEPDCTFRPAELCFSLLAAALGGGILTSSQKKTGQVYLKISSLGTHPADCGGWVFDSALLLHEFFPNQKRHYFIPYHRRYPFIPRICCYPNQLLNL
jgi:hypothetical protein